MADFLTVSSQLMCPHGGTVNAVTGNTRVKAGGELLVRGSDTFLVGGCPFALGSQLHPCTEVQWLVPAAESQATGDSAVTQGSSGICKAADQAPQGSPQVIETQAQSSGT